MTAHNRFNAARAAALAVSGTGKDQLGPDVGEMARWRKDALKWLLADLAHYQKQAATSLAKARSDIVNNLTQWRTETDLAGIRDDVALKSRPAEERDACRALWVEVDSLLAKVDAAGP
jgi:hypothetical protein